MTAHSEPTPSQMWGSRRISFSGFAVWQAGKVGHSSDREWGRNDCTMETVEMARKYTVSELQAALRIPFASKTPGISKEGSRSGSYPEKVGGKKKTHHATTNYNPKVFIIFFKLSKESNGFPGVFLLLHAPSCRTPHLISGDIVNLQWP